MNKIVSVCVVTASLLAGESAWAAISITPDFTILTGVKDASNLDGSGFRFRGSLSTESGDPDYYVNAVTLIPGGNYDPGLGLYMPSDGGVLSLGDGTQYTLGTPIPADTFVSLNEVASHSGPVDSGLATGIYDFAIEFRGGESSSASDLLASWALQVEVVDSIDASATGVATPGVPDHRQPLRQRPGHLGHPEQPLPQRRRRHHRQHRHHQHHRRRQRHLPLV